MVRDEKDDRLLPHQIRRQRLTERATNPRNTSGKRVESVFRQKDQKFGKVWTSWAQSLRAKIRGKDHMRTPCSKKDAFTKYAWDLAKNIYKLKNADKATFYSSVVAKGNAGTYFNIPRQERYFVVEPGGVNAHDEQKMNLMLRRTEYFAKIQEPSLWCLRAIGEVQYKWGSTGTRSRSKSLRDCASTRRNALLFYRLENSAKTTDIPMSGSAVKNHGWPKQEKTMCMQNGQLPTSCCSRVIHQFW